MSLINAGSTIVWEHEYKCLLLKVEELTSLLIKAGFKSVERIEVEGEKNYDVYLARK